MERFFQIPLVRPRTRLLLQTIKSRSDCEYLLREVSGKEEVFVLRANLHVKFLASSEFSDEEILNVINSEMRRHNLPRTEELERVVRNGLASYKCWVHQMKFFRKKAQELKQKEIALLDEICFAFQEEEEVVDDAQFLQQ